MMVTDWESDSVVGVDTLVDTFDTFDSVVKTFSSNSLGAGERGKGRG